MSDPVLISYGLLALASLLLSAFYSGIETGLYTINRVRLTVRAEHGDRAAVRLQNFLSNPNRMLSTILMASNIVNYLSSFAIAAIINQFGFSPGQAVALNASLLIPVLFVLSETLPKDLFRTHTDRWSYACSSFLVWSDRLLSWLGLVPLVMFIGGRTARLLGSDVSRATTARQRMSHLIKEGMGAGVLTEAQTTLADRALAMRDQRVGGEMIPWKRVASISIDGGRADIEAVCRSRQYSRLPVLDRAGRAVGILSVMDALLNPSSPVQTLMQSPILVPANVPIRDVLRRLRADRQTMAIVIDARNEQPIGLVTIKDLVEPLTGELAAW
jgi:CBS domain containing-hemolysin-like protein